MINTERNSNGVVDKQLAGTLKKTALRDVQNENVGPIHKKQDSVPHGGGKSSVDAVKVCGTKRLTPERPSSSQSLPSLAYNGTNENVMNARRRFELELGRGRLQNNVEKFSDSVQSKKMVQSQQEIPQKPSQVRDSIVASNNMSPIMAFSSTSPSVPSYFGKQAAKVSPDFPRNVDSKSTTDQLRTERYIRLQKFLKQCDEDNQREYIQKLLHLSPAELSKHAVDLEKRAIQLTLEEGNEMQRKMSLNILPKPSPTNDLLPPTRALPNKS
ncbi:hypothetical protein ACJIZ3_003284 [Penstemon smallii]|uniref:Uncharacterized protein n=1 Tax=Penstemon smallii TaxID=265156 RepID=A0ABD3UAT1_9LAMI